MEIYVDGYETGSYTCRNGSGNLLAEHGTIVHQKISCHTFAINDFEVPGYVVCYGIHEGRFIIWEPGFGPMQYWENQMKTLWIRGITLTLFPTHEFMQKTDFQLKWWELYPWSRKWKRRLNRWYEYIWLNYPWFREMVTQLRRK